MQSKTGPIDIPQVNSPPKWTERDQMPYSKLPSDAGIIKEPGNIERHRQPYTAKPGNGKVYVESLAVPNRTRPGRAYSTGRAPRDHEAEPEYRARHIRTQSNASNDQFTLASRPGAGGGYLPEQFSSPPKHSQPLSPTLYTTTKYIPPSSEMRERDRDRDRDHDRYRDTRRSERRNTNDEPRSRRNTITDPSRLPPELTTPRNAERWDRMYENRDKSRDRDRKSEPKSAGPILHQEIRPDPRITEPDLPDEEYYLRAPALPHRSREYEIDKGGKYYDRR